MNHRRLVGIDLGISSAHTVRVLDGEGNVIAKRKAVPDLDSLTAVEAAALADAPAGTRLEVVMEPTGPAWLPIAVFFSARGHSVFRVRRPPEGAALTARSATPPRWSNEGGRRQREPAPSPVGGGGRVR